MYYTSQNKSELVAYNETVNSAEGYNGTTTHWAEIIKHPNGTNYAVLKHRAYNAELTFVESLSEDWFLNEI